MNETNEHDQINSHYASWWDKAVHYTTREKWKPAVQDYFDFHQIPYNHEKFSLEFARRVISHVTPYDERWRKFHLKSFDPQTYKAHQAFYLMVEDEYTRLVEDADVKAQEAQEKKKQDQLEKQSEDEAYANTLEKSIANNRGKRNRQVSAGVSIDARSNTSSG